MIGGDGDLAIVSRLPGPEPRMLPPPHKGLQPLLVPPLRVASNRLEMSERPNKLEQAEEELVPWRPEP